MKKTEAALAAHLEDQKNRGTLKGVEEIFVEVTPPKNGLGPRFRLEGEGDREFLRMNSNSYLGMSFRPEVLRAEEEASERYGVGPGAVRFISGTWAPHVALEATLARFHGREAGMIFSAAYVTVLGVLGPLIDKETAVISDALNHNCIINALRLSRPLSKHVYPHLDLSALEDCLVRSKGAKRAIVVTDGIFSMRGDHAPLDRIHALCRRFDEEFEQGVVLVVDDSHGVGAFGETGRGTEEYTQSAKVDVLIGTLGKAFGVNGGYVVGSSTLVEYLRETAPMYIYSNPITAGEAAASQRSIELLDSTEGRDRLSHLRAMTRRFETGLQRLGLETIPGQHPVVPLMVRETERTSALVTHLKANGVLATGLNFPVVPKGDEEIRFQVNASHTEADIDYCLSVLGSFD